MNNMASVYVKDDAALDMMKFGSSTLGPSEGLFSAWNPGGGYTEMTYAPGEYLNNKETSYDSYVERQAGGDFTEWAGTTPSLLNSPLGAPSEASFNDFLSPTALANTPPAWNTDGYDRRASDDLATASAISEMAASKQSNSKSRIAKRKVKSPPTKVRSRSDTKAKSISSACSSSSSTSSTSRLSNSGHGGNHNITLRTASRKPKPIVKPEDGRNSPDSSPSSPDAGGDNLTSEERRARQNHNVVEKQYRNRLNVQFERLLAILPANQADEDGTSRHGEFDERRMSKAEVLDMARRRIHSLEQERKQLCAERETLLENVSLMQRAIQRQQLGLVSNSS